MDKKNTMLLTVIAVATLLVAVVGATFAFFTATNEAKGTTAVTTTTEAVGAVTITNPTPAMHITLQASEMTEAYVEGGAKSFWATATSARWVATEEWNSVSKINVASGTNDTKYTCSYNLTVTKPTDVVAGDMAISFDLVDATMSYEDGAKNVTAKQEIDLVEAANATFKVEFTQVGNVTDKDLVKAAVRFTNRKDAQDYLLGDTLLVDITNSELKCTVSKNAQ